MSEKDKCLSEWVSDKTVLHTSQPFPLSCSKKPQEISSPLPIFFSHTCCVSESGRFPPLNWWAPTTRPTSPVPWTPTLWPATRSNGSGTASTSTTRSGSWSRTSTPAAPRTCKSGACGPKMRANSNARLITGSAATWSIPPICWWEQGPGSMRRLPTLRRPRIKAKRPLWSAGPKGPRWPCSSGIETAMRSNQMAKNTKLRQKWSTGNIFIFLHFKPY